METAINTLTELFELSLFLVTERVMHVHTVNDCLKLNYLRWSHLWLLFAMKRVKEEGADLALTSRL